MKTLKIILLFSIISVSCKHVSSEDRSRLNATNVDESELNKRIPFLVNLPVRREGEQCEKSWDPITNDKKITMVIALGYHDVEFRGSLLALDGNFKDILIKHLISPCKDSYNACGKTKKNLKRSQYCFIYVTALA